MLKFLPRVDGNNDYRADEVASQESRQIPPRENREKALSEKDDGN
jgi:hypothetical protein